MQAIARANRVYEGKTNGLIVDYIGILKNLRDALVTYTSGDGQGGGTPTPPQEELLKKLEEAFKIIQQFLIEKGFQIQILLKAEGFSKIQILKEAKEAINESSETRRRMNCWVKLIL